MFDSLILAIPIAFTWAVVTGNAEADSFLVGYILGVTLLLLLKSRRVEMRWQKLPDQLLALVIYSIILARDVIMASIDVARRVLNPHLPLNPGIVAVSTEDETQHDAIGAFSAHGITLTPGELVVDFEDGHTMYVHCLDAEASGKTLHEGQKKRLKLLKRIMGR